MIDFSFNKPPEQMLAERNLQNGGKVQKFIDSEVVRYSEPKVPFMTGNLKKAVGTVYGSGTVVYNTPYAKKNYYDNKGMGTQGISKGGQRGRLWFQRMKADHANAILLSAKKWSGAV